jgi:pimeloyl-ACP methyl ester carboxylesterase
VPSGYAEVNGLRMYYEVHGDGPPVLLLHGDLCSIEIFSEQIPRFSPEFTLIAPEQMGHGRTADDPRRDFHYHDLAEDTIALMDQLDIGSAHIIGWSGGGILGYDIAINHPERVRKLVAAGANFRYDGASQRPTDPELVANIADDLRSFEEAYGRLSPDGRGYWARFRERMRSMRGEPNYTKEQLASIKAPTLVTVGDQDFISLEHAVETYRAIPDAQLFVIPRADHGAPARKSALWNETVLGFLREPLRRENARAVRN